MLLERGIEVEHVAAGVIIGLRDREIAGHGVGAPAVTVHVETRLIAGLKRIARYITVKAVSQRRAVRGREVQKPWQPRVRRIRERNAVKRIACRAKLAR